MSEHQAASPAAPTAESYRINWKLTALLFAVTTVILFVSSPRLVFVTTEVLIFILFASALNLVLSYSGMVSFGHAVYFGLGAYGLALTIDRFDWPIWAGILAGPVLSAMAGLVYGFLSVQLTFIYAGMITLACAEVTFGIAHQWFEFTGGESGITGFIPARLGMGPATFGFVVLCVVTLGVLFLYRVVHSPLGVIIRSVGQNPARAAAMGHSRKTVQLIAFTISGFVAGIAGTLFGLFHANVFPDYVGVLYTIDGLVMVLLGGLYSFSAGIYGAVVYQLFEELVSHYFELWQLAIGVLLLIIILVSPEGIKGLVDRMLAKLRKGGTHA